MSRVIISSYYDGRDDPCDACSGSLVVRQIARYLSRSHEVMVISGSLPGYRQEQIEPFQQMNVPTGWVVPQAGQAVFHHLLAKVAMRVTHDLWIESFPSVSFGVVPSVTSKPVIALAQRSSVHDRRRRKGPLAHKQRKRLAGYERFVVPDEATCRLVRRARHDANCTIIPNGVGLPDAPAPPGQGGHILYLGRIDVERKGLDLLLAAITAAKPQLPLLVAGAGTPAEETKLTRLFQQNCGPVARVGHVSGPAKETLLRDCAFLVLPSRCDTSGQAALEALAWGKPVVHFDLPWLRWIGDEAAVRVPAFDVDALAVAIRTLAIDDVRRSRMSWAARRTAERYSWPKIGQRYLDIVDRCLSRQNIRDGFRKAAG